MFAGCIDTRANSDCCEQLLACLGDPGTGGLAGIPFDEQAHWQAPGAVLVQQRQWITLESRKETGVVGDPQSKLLFWGRLDNRPELAALLAADGEDTDAALVLAAWNRWGQHCCKHLIGDFALAIYQPEKGRVFLARDHFGVKPLYVYRDASRLVFATSMVVLKDLPALALRPSRNWLARYLLDCSPDWRLTPWESVEKIQPAHYLDWFAPSNHSAQSAQTPTATQTAWYQFGQQAPERLATDADYVQRYRQLIQRAIDDRLRGLSPVGDQEKVAIGIECSGGLDSAAICALAASSSNASSVQLHSFGFLTQRDEPEAVRQVEACMRPASSTHLGPGHAARCDWQQLHRAFAQSAGSPLEHGNAVTQVPFYEAAQAKNIRIMLSGFGGDEFTSVYATTALAEFWYARKWRLWGSRFRGGWLGRKLRMLHWLYRLWRHGPGTRTAHKLLAAARRRLALSPVQSALVEEFGLQQLCEQQARYDLGCRSLNEFVLGDRWSPRISARLESCTLMAARYGIEYRWPLLDVRLVEWFLGVPAKQKLGPGGIGRYLHRRALDGILPDAIVWRDKDMGPALAEPHSFEIEDFIEKTNLNRILKEIVNPDYRYVFDAGWGAKELADTSVDAQACERLWQLNNWLNWAFPESAESSGRDKKP